MMRLSWLRARGFRAFADQVEVDLSGDVIVLSGPNGQGKTSLLDAILWALSGSVARLQGTAENVVSLYSPTGEAEVEVGLAADGSSWTVLRAWDGTSERLHIRGPESSLSGREAAVKLSRLLKIPAESSAAGGLSSPALHTALTRAIYLQQDLVREFVEADDETSRYENLSQLFGTRRIVDLQLELERQKANWSKSLNADKRLGSDADAVLRRLEGDIEGLEAGAIEGLEPEAWVGWWKALREVIDAGDQPHEMSSSEAPVALDRNLRSLEAARRSAERRLATLDELTNEVSALPELKADDSLLEIAERELETTERARQEIEQHLASAEAALAKSRQEAARVHDAAQDRALFAKLALRHLEEICPVCRQAYDREETEQRLRAESATEFAAAELPDASHVDQLRTDLRAAGEAALAARRRLDALSEGFQRTQRQRAQLIEHQLQAVAEAPVAEWLSRLSAEGRSIRERVRRIREVQEQGERLTLLTARAGEAARLEALRAEQASALLRRDQLVADLQAREQTAEVAQGVIEGLRTAGQTVVSEELKRIRPMAQRIYSAIDPHPAFRRIDVTASMFRGRGRVTTAVEDPDAARTSDRPAQVLSSSQLNALALSLFLSWNIGSRDLPLQTLILDDPLQTLDDINLLGLVDVLRRIVDARQMIISTHDVRFSSLLERKLRPVRQGGRTLSISVASWSREGPEIRVREVEPPRTLFVVA